MTVVATGVSVTRGRREVLHDVHLAVAESEVLALVGPNGAGKSTLLAVLAGDLAPTRGTVRIGDQDVQRLPTAQLATQRAVLVQQSAVAFPFTVEEVVRMGRAPWRRTPQAARDDEHVAAALEAADLEELAGQPVTRLSGGEQARVALARVLAQDTPLVLLDEPTAALDLRHQEEALDQARRLADAGRAVVVVLHDLGQAAAHADRVALLHRGRLVAVGTPRDVLTGARLTEVYGHPVDVLDHPVTGSLLVTPVR